MTEPTIRPGSIIRGPTLPEAVEVLALVPMGDSLKVIGRGLKSGLTYDPVLSPRQMRRLDPEVIEQFFAIAAPAAGGRWPVSRPE